MPFVPPITHWDRHEVHQQNFFLIVARGAGEGNSISTHYIAVRLTEVIALPMSGAAIFSAVGGDGEL